MATALEKASIQRAQIREMQERFDSMRADKSMYDENLKQVVGVVADIIRIWQQIAGESDPTDYCLSFGHRGATATLRQVLALVPEQYQDHIVLLGNEQSEYGFKSWLDESIMNVLVHLAADDTAPNTYFAHGLALDARVNLDALTMGTHTSRLKYLIDGMKAGGSDWNINNSYTVPKTTARVVCFWNYYENHWSVLTIDISDEQWSYIIYNPLVDDTPVDCTLESMMEHAQDVGTLICAASGISPAAKLPLPYFALPAQQENTCDCGVFAVDNALALLQKRQLSTFIDPLDRRLDFLTQILGALEAGQGTKIKRNKDGDEVSPPTEILAPPEAGQVTDNKQSNFEEIATPAEIRWANLKSVLEQGEIFDHVLVTAINRHSNLKERVLAYIDKALMMESSDEEVLREIRMIPYQ